MLKTARLLTLRKACPCCGARTDRVRTPRSIRWLKTFLGPNVSFRRCFACRGWVGMTVAPPTNRRRGGTRPAPIAAAPGPVVLLSDEPADAAVLASALVTRGNEVIVLGKTGVCSGRVARFVPRLVLVHEPTGNPESAACRAMRERLGPVDVVAVSDNGGLAGSLALEGSGPVAS